MPTPIQSGLFAGLLALFSSAVFSETVIVNLEEPSTDGFYTGISNLRGWAVAELCARPGSGRRAYAFGPSGAALSDARRDARPAVRLDLPPGEYDLPADEAPTAWAARR